MALADQFDNKTIIMENKNTQLKNYDKALEVLPKYISGVKNAIQISDRNGGLIVVNTYTKCKSLSQWGIGYMDLHFTLTINSKKNKIRLKFEHLDNWYNNEPNTWDYVLINSQEKLDKTYDECLKPIVLQIEEELNKSDEF